MFTARWNLELSPAHLKVGGASIDKQIIYVLGQKNQPMGVLPQAGRVTMTTIMIMMMTKRVDRDWSESHDISRSVFLLRFSIRDVTNHRTIF